MNKTARLLTIAFMSLALIVAGALPALAQAPATPPKQPTPKGGPSLVDEPQRWPWAPPALWPELAEALDIDLDELQARLADGATLADLAQEAGVDLQELRDLAENAHQGGLWQRLGQALIKQSVRGEDRPLRLNDAASLAAAAETLGMTVDQLELQLWGGRTLADLAERADVDLADVQEAVEQARLDAYRERLAQAVKDERISPEQADWLLVGAEQGWLVGPGMGCGPDVGMWGLARTPWRPAT